MSLLGHLRTVFTLGRGLVQGLPEASAERDPIELFGEWFEAAERSGILLPEALTLATCTRNGVPSARQVLLKRHDADGFVFYTNYGSRKARELEENPRAALLIHWPVLQRQVRIDGSVTRASEEESSAYFHSRPRGSQIGAWASRQSEFLSSRAELERRVSDYERKFKGGEVPLPEFWGGYRLVPEQIEFWQGRANRLHDRLLFSRSENGWSAERLYP